MDNAYGIAQTEDGYIVVGSTKSTDGDVTIDWGNMDGWVVRLDQAGQMIWQRSYGGSLGDDLYDVFDAGDGNFLLAGSTASQDGTIGDNPYPGTWSFWFMKVDGEGNIIWQTIAGGPNTNWLWAAYPTADGGIIGVGEIYGVGGDISAFYGAVDAWVVKLNDNGQVEWDFTAGTPPTPNFASGIEFGNSVIQTSDGGYLVAANGTVGLDGSLDCVPPPKSQASGILVKLDANGQHDWSRCYGGTTGHESILDVVEVADGYVYTGIAASTDGDLTGCGLHNPNTTDVWVAKIDFEGNMLWQHCYGGSDYDQGSSIMKLPEGGLVVKGHTPSHDGDVSHNYGWQGKPNIWLLRLDNEGQLLHEACYGGALKAEALTRNNLLVLNNNKLVVAGTTETKPHHPPEQHGNVDCGNTYTGNSNSDWWVFEIYDTTVYVQEHFNTAIFKIFPNPATTQAWLQLPENTLLAQAQIELYSPTGRLLYKAQPTSQFHKIEVAHLPKGLYLVRVWDGERWRAEKLVVR